MMILASKLSSMIFLDKTAQCTFSGSVQRDGINIYWSVGLNASFVSHTVEKNCGLCTDTKTQVMLVRQGNFKAALSASSL